jgi:Protein of unknown function (DUF2867)
MTVTECNVPSSSVLDRALIGRADFRDSYQVRLSRSELGIVDIFFGIFGHLPLLPKVVLIVRNTLASLIGLEAPTASEILHLEIRGNYTVGDKIWVWPIFFLGENEIVAGRDNKHMDFRLSVLKLSDGDVMSVVVTTGLHRPQLVWKILSVGHRPIPQTWRAAIDVECRRGEAIHESRTIANPKGDGR